MLAQNQKSLTMILTIAVALTTSFVFGQQPQLPSQRYQPVPPSVHIPPTNAERIQLRQVKDRAQLGMAPVQKRINSGQSTSYRFSDENAPMPAYERGTVQQTSYVSDGNEIQVPNILAGRQTQDKNKSATSAEQQPRSASEDLESSQIAPADVASEPINATATEMVNQIQRSNPLVDAQALEHQQKIAEQQLRQIRERAAAAASNLEQASYQTSRTSQEVPESPREAMSSDEFMEQPMAAKISEVSTSVTQPPEQATVAQTIENSVDVETPMLTAKPIQVASSNLQIGEPVNQIRQVANETQGQPISQPVARPPLTRKAAEITLSAPGIEVQTFGPRSIGINKTSTYKIIVTNRGSIDAKQLLIGINMPQWVDIANTILTNGQKEITDGIKQARLVWTVDHVPANSAQTITIETVPRKAEMFDLGVEWTFAPQVGMTSIDVTEPKLEMKIAGPRDVLYGEKAIYHVTVRNPGTGTAENVTVMLPEALGGERASLGEITAGREKNFQVELLARTAGQLDLAATAKADGNLNTQAIRQITVRRAELGVIIDGPPMKYAGGVGQYMITINNTGDATAQDVVAAIALPTGIKYLSGVDSAKEIEGGLRWQVGTIDAGDQRTFKINCELNAAGDLQIEAGARGQGDLAASSACVTTVETVADLILTVMDPKGPLPTGEDVIYQIRVKNRGTRAARDVQLVMQFSEGIEPNAAQGLQHRVVPGQILFSPIAQVDPDEEMEFQVMARAQQPGTHVFRAQLTCADSDAREIAEGTTRFFGEAIEVPVDQEANTTADATNEFAPEADSTEFKR